jgi:hypothetical protein
MAAISMVPNRTLRIHFPSAVTSGSGAGITNRHQIDPGNSQEIVKAAAAC